MYHDGAMDRPVSKVTCIILCTTLCARACVCVCVQCTCAHVCVCARAFVMRRRRRSPDRTWKSWRNSAVLGVEETRSLRPWTAVYIIMKKKSNNNNNEINLTVGLYTNRTMLATTTTHDARPTTAVSARSGCTERPRGQQGACYYEIVINCLKTADFFERRKPENLRPKCRNAWKRAEMYLLIGRVEQQPFENNNNRGNIREF